MKKNSILVICWVMLAACGCNQNCKERGECDCVSRYDCNGENEICINGVCVAEEQPIWIIPDRAFGESCTGHRDCIDGICLPEGPNNGGVCTVSCEAAEDCPNHWTCNTWTGKEITADHVCVPEITPKLCNPCTVDAHCNATGDLCIRLDEGNICARDCSLQDCPTGYTCESIERDGTSYLQCIPLDNSCECGPGKEGMGKSCTNENTFGVCSGWSYCSILTEGYAWSACDAQIPAEEVCNGKDDDCDGLTDTLDPGITHSDLGDAGNLYPLCYLGGCVGHFLCEADVEGKFGWRCDAGDPAHEVCNGVDDNCNGQIDEGYTNDDGIYLHDENCGTCGTSCTQILSNLKKDANGEVVAGAAACQLRDDNPVCVPIQCEDGYYPYPHEAPVSCIKLESPACEVCGADSDCHVYSDQCMELRGDFGSHCLQSCEPDSPYNCTGITGAQSCCPAGFTCEMYEGAKRCIPLGESCSCDATKVGMVRNCVVASGTDVCQGRQTCEDLGNSMYAWSTCSAQSLTVEVCDGQDNNCNGEVDEDFIDDKGRYNNESHCGECNNDCPSRWKAPELHSEGACLPDGDNYSCQFTGCKLEEQVVGKRCSDDADCGSGMRCDRQVFYCVSQNAQTPEVSCSSDADCAGIDRAHRCIDKVCRVKVQYHDVNGIEADGCECGVAIDGGTDEPETFLTFPNEFSSYVDRNCDGIDGVAETSIFVSSQSTASHGTIEHPYKTIGEAIQAFNPTKHTAILVAAGTYMEQVVLKSGVRIYGGYASDFKSRNIILNPTQILAPPPADDSQPGTVYIPSVNRRTIISGFTIQGYDMDESITAAGSRGRNTYGIYVAEASNQIYITNNVIEAGRAGDGGQGKTGDSGYAGTDGEPGQNSRECSNKHCQGQTTSGGNGGKNSHCSSAAGRTGATAAGGDVMQDFVGSDRDGKGGQNNSYAHNYIEHYAYCKYDCQSGGYANAENGKDGTNGSSGAGGSGCKSGIGKVYKQDWVGNSGNSGTEGSAARGGGGGGAGGSAVNRNDASCSVGNLLGDIGGSGGGGGAGGCGGDGGGAGGAGGGAFGIWIAQLQSDPQIRGNKVHLGIGGNGGNGGDGGAGGKGGRGGVGGQNLAPAWCAGAGGTGGTGGDGGSGGGGGGGCGGVSIGIAGIGFNASSVESYNNFEYPEGGQNAAAGNGGTGGYSPGSSANQGSDGAKGSVQFSYAFQ